MTDERKEIVVAEESPTQLAVFENQEDIIRRFAAEQNHSFLRSGGPITRLALSGDDKRIAGASRRVVSVWDNDTDERIDRFMFEFYISAMAMSPDGSEVYVADGDRNALWAVSCPGGKRRRLMNSDAGIVEIDVAMSGLVVAGSALGTVGVLDPTKEQPLFSLSCGERPWRLRADSEADELIVEMDGAVSLYRLSNGNRLARSRRRAPVIVDSRAGVQIIDPDTGECRHRIVTFYTAQDHTRDRSTVVTANRSGVTVWCSETGERVRQIDTYVHGPDDLKLSHDGKHFYICGEDTTIDKYSVDGSRHGTIADTYCPIMAAAQSGDNLVVVDQRGVLAVYDIRSGEAERFYHHQSCVSKMHVLGNRVATGAYDGTARVLDLETRKVVRTINHRGIPVQAVALDASGMLVTGTRAGMLRRYDTNDGKLMQSYHGNRGAIRSTAISPCGRYVMSTSDTGRINVFDYFSGELLSRRNERSMIYSGTFDATGDYVFYGTSSGEVVKSKSTDGTVIARWKRHGICVRSVVLSGNKLVTVGIDDHACILDPETGEQILKCGIDAPLFRRVAFLNDEHTRLVTGGQDGRLRFHDPATGKVLAELLNLDTGYLWATRDDGEIDGPDWFWTSRPDMIEVYEQLGETRTFIPRSDKRHDEYVQAHNSKVATMSRVGMCREAISNDVAGLCQSYRDQVSDNNRQALLEFRQDPD